MELVIRQAAEGTSYPNGQESQRLRDRYWIKADLPAEKHLFTLTGRLLLEFTSTSMAHYDYLDVRLHLFLEGRPLNRKPSASPRASYDVCELVSENWTASSYLSAVSNDSTATNAGWSVETINFVPSSVRGWVEAIFRVGCRDTDGHVLSIGYRLETVGHYEWKPVFPIN